MQSLDEHLQINTPENVSFGYEVAGIGSRFLAALVDTTIIILLQVLANVALLAILFGMDGIGDAIASDGLINGSFSWVLAIIGLISFLFFWGYYIFFEMIWNGRSPGKALAKLRVIRTDGTPITLTESVVRNLVRLVDFLPVYYAVGVIAMFINHQSRRLGDLAAGTLVVREGAERVSLPDLSSVMRVSETPVERMNTGIPSLYPVERLTAQDIQMVESFLSRRVGMSNRAALAVQLAAALRKRMQLPPESLSPALAEEMLITVHDEYRRRRG